MCIMALSRLRQREWLRLAPRGKPQSLNYAPEIAFGRAAVIWRFIFLFQLVASRPSRCGGWPMERAGGPVPLPGVAKMSRTAPWGIVRDVPPGGGTRAARSSGGAAGAPVPQGNGCCLAGGPPCPRGLASGAGVLQVESFTDTQVFAGAAGASEPERSLFLGDSEAIAILTPFPGVFSPPSHVGSTEKRTILVRFRTFLLPRSSSLPHPAPRPSREMRLGGPCVAAPGAGASRPPAAKGMMDGQAAVGSRGGFPLPELRVSPLVSEHPCPTSWLCPFGTSSDRAQDPSPPHEWGAGAALPLSKVGGCFCPPIKAPCTRPPPAQLWGETQPPAPRWASRRAAPPRPRPLPVYSGKQMVRGDFLIFSANRSFLLRKRMMEVSMKNLLLQMESKSMRDSCMRFCNGEHGEGRERQRERVRGQEDNFLN